MIFQRASVVLTLFFISGLLCADLDLNALEEDFPDLKNFDKDKLPHAEDLEKLLEEKCNQTGGGMDAYNEIQKEKLELMSCLTNMLNFTQIQIEIDEAKKTGSMDEVFGKYCAQYPEFQNCSLGLSNAVTPCLTEEEQATKKELRNITDQLQEFICFKNGDRLAMFVAEGGVECFESQKDFFQQCFNSTFGSKMSIGELSLDTLPKFVFNTETCNSIEKARICVNEGLEKCENSTSANLVNALFKFLRKILPCKADFVPESKELIKPEPQESKSSAKNLLISSFTLVISFIFVRGF